MGLVGVGALGRHHARILSELPDADFVGVHDVRSDAASEVARTRGTLVFDSLDELAEAAEAMVVAVPTVAHAEVGCRLLDAGLHVLVEKPLASTLDEADRLVETAGSNRVLAVGHVEFYNPAVQALLASASTPRFIEVQRLSVFTRRSLDIDVVLDLMIHDLQILQALDPSPVTEIRAAGVEVLSQRTDIANARLELASGCVANLTASRVSAERIRRLRVFLRDEYLSLDYQKQTLRGFRLEEAVRGGGPGEGTARITGVELEVTPEEPLRREIESFIALCRGESAPYVDGHMGRQALASALGVAAAISERRAQ